MQKLGHAIFFGALSLISLVPLACSKSTPTVFADGGVQSSTSCDGAPTLTDDSFCDTCTFATNAQQSTCKTPRTIDACCVYVVPPPTTNVTRGTGLNYFSSTDPTVDLGCLATPPVAGTSKTITLQGHVRLFSSGSDSAGVKIEIFNDAGNGVLGSLIGAAFVTTSDDATDPAQIETWKTSCPQGGCKLRSFSYPNVPTETPLIIKTSDATGTGAQWSDLYDYNVYIANSVVTDDEAGAPSATYDPSCVAPTDVNTVASAAGGFTISPTKGVLAGEVHDCSDVRLSGATVDTDVAHDASVFYFGSNESDPLPDSSQSATSVLGLFGMLNIESGVPIRISAVGTFNNATVLLGTYTVQTYPGAVTALSFRGRRPFQQ